MMNLGKDLRDEDATLNLQGAISECGQIGFVIQVEDRLSKVLETMSFRFGIWGRGVSYLEDEIQAQTQNVCFICTSCT